MREIEAKIRLEPGEGDTLRERLTNLGAERGAAEQEENLLFDAPDGHIRAAGQTLRLRQIDGRADALLTFKGAAEPDSQFKSREELEVWVSDMETAQRILAALGFLYSGSYSKQREHWSFLGCDVTLDRLSSGDYVEIEGAEESIGSVLMSLGLVGRPHIAEGYATLESR